MARQSSLAYQGPGAPSAGLVGELDIDAADEDLRRHLDRQPFFVGGNPRGRLAHPLGVSGFAQIGDFGNDLERLVLLALDGDTLLGDDVERHQISAFAAEYFELEIIADLEIETAREVNRRDRVQRIGRLEIEVLALLAL